MKKSTLVLALMLPLILAAQKRYFDPVFQDIRVTSDVTYGVNSTVLYSLFGLMEPVAEELKMDVYEPEGDSATARPLIILLHGGFFLPPAGNGNCYGNKQDGEVVSLATRLAQSGYVVASADYRLGWNLYSSIELIRRFWFVNAIHRGVQDSRTCIRYFRKDQSETNQFRIDPDKITLWGTETGSIITLASATLDNMSDWDQLKFIYPNFGPMVLDSINGDLNGTTIGIVSESYQALIGYPIGDTLCTPNHIGYSSDFALAVDMAGQLIELDWLRASDVPIISFAAPNAFPILPYLLNPCGIGDFGLWGSSPWPILYDLAGSCAIQAKQAQLGNNALWTNASFDDPLTAHALDINGGIEGFYPFWGATKLTPWAFTRPPIPMGAMCDTNSVVAGAYLDTVLAYFAPRACAVLGLNSNCNPAVATKEPLTANYILKISPNPAVDETRIVTIEPILSVELYDIYGKVVWQKTGMNDLEIHIPRVNWPNGMYWLKAHFAKGLGQGKIIWQ